MTETINTHHERVDFGRHRGELWTRVPVNYLRWMVRTNHPKADMAQAELDRRGTHVPDLDVSGHALDRASTNCYRTWRKSREKGEGIHAWLCRVAREALEAGRTDGKGNYRHLNCRFCFEMNGAWPVLKTIIYEGPRRRGSGRKQEEIEHAADQ